MKRSVIGLALLVALLAEAHAQTQEPAKLGEWWLNAGFATYHFQRDKDLNGSNPGLGLEYRYTEDAALTAGRFYNSDREYSSYAGWYYQPLRLGPLRLGAVVGAFNGYPKMRDGGWFPALIPVASMEYRRVGFNLAFVPSYKDRLYGGLSLQVKVKLTD